MKKILMLLLAAGALTATPASAQKQDPQGNFYVGTAFDTARGNATKVQSADVSDPAKGYTLQVLVHPLTDTITGVVSVWASLDGTTYLPYPGLDSVTITAATDCKKLWFVNTHVAGNPVKKIQVRTRCASNTTNATSKAKVTSKLWPY